jgi:hypothetical protein
MHTGTTFTERDIKDKHLLEKEIEAESNRIFYSPAANQGRTLNEIRKAVRQGKTAEIWLCENEKFKLATDIWHDLIDEDGNYVEVKAYGVTSSSAPYVQNAISRIKNGGWNKSKYMLLFNYNGGTYKFLEKINIR